MNFLNILCNITFKKDFIQLETPLFTSCVKYTFGDEFHENKEYMTYGSWEIFLHNFRQFAKEIGKSIHIPRAAWFNNVHRLYHYHVLPSLKKLLEEKPNRYPHTFVFALPYFVNDQGELEIAASSVLVDGNFSHTPYRKEVKFSTAAVIDYNHRLYWAQVNGEDTEGMNRIVI